MSIELQAGYYEWNLYVNGEYAYTFGDLSEEIADCYTRDDFFDLSRDLLYLMFTDLHTLGKIKEFPIPAEQFDIERAAAQMSERLYFEYGAIGILTNKT